MIFVFAVASIPSFAAYAGGRVTVLVLVALFVTLIPTTIGALLSAIGIGRHGQRLVRFNVLAMSGRAVEAAGDVDTLLLDKTGTITLGNRQASEFLALPGVDERELAEAAQLASLSDETPEGPVHCRTGEGQIRPPQPRAARREIRALLGADAHQRCRFRRFVDSQGRGGRGAWLGGNLASGCPRAHCLVRRHRQDRWQRLWR